MDNRMGRSQKANNTRKRHAIFIRNDDSGFSVFGFFKVIKKAHAQSKSLLLKVANLDLSLPKSINTKLLSDSE